MMDPNLNLSEANTPLAGEETTPPQTGSAHHLMSLVPVCVFVPSVSSDQVQRQFHLAVDASFPHKKMDHVNAAPWWWAAKTSNKVFFQPRLMIGQDDVWAGT